MSGKHLALAFASALLCVGRAHAIGVSYDTFNVDFFEDDGAWVPGADFQMTSNPDISTSGFHNNFCPSGDWWSCICDPGIKLTVPDPPPPPTPFDGSLTIGPIGLDGTFTESFINDGPNINSLLFTTSDFTDDETYNCSSEFDDNPYEQFFRHCGFKLSETGSLEILFWDPIADITTAPTPEPGQDALLLLALGAAAMVQRIRARRNRSISQ